jgi:hypothetical protein
MFHLLLMKSATERYKKSIAIQSLKSLNTKMEWTLLDRQIRVNSKGGTYSSLVL